MTMIERMAEVATEAFQVDHDRGLAIAFTAMAAMAEMVGDDRAQALNLAGADVALGAMRIEDLRLIMDKTGGGLNGTQAVEHGTDRR